jgi:2-polyprenyl-3-methyl-5-hydroxy-6-metoxy-1,4-benzoquinol methylase
MGDHILHGIHLWERWGTLTECVRQGTAVEFRGAEDSGARYFPTLVRALFPRNYPIACEGYDRSGIGRESKGLRVLDVAGGSAPWSIPLAERNPRTRVTLIDFPDPIEIAREFSRKHHVSDQVQFIEGNLWDVDWGTDRFDLVIFGHICHSEGEKGTREMIRRAFRALRPGGRLLIAEMVADDTRSAPGSWPLMFAVNMLVNTEAGDTFTFSEYRRWCEAGGFTAFKTVPVSDHSPLLVATKRP